MGDLADGIYDQFVDNPNTEAWEDDDYEDYGEHEDADDDNNTEEVDA